MGKIPLNERISQVNYLLSDLRQNFIDIGYHLYMIHRDYDVDIYRFAEDNFGIGRTSTHNLLAVCSNYCGGTRELLDKFRGYSQSQLVEMLGIKYAPARELIPQDTTVEEIRKFKKIVNCDSLTPFTYNQCREVLNFDKEYGYFHIDDFREYLNGKRSFRREKLIKHKTENPVQTSELDCKSCIHRIRVDEVTLKHCIYSAAIKFNLDDRISYGNEFVKYLAAELKQKYDIYLR